jgi:hypothetical protein
MQSAHDFDPFTARQPKMRKKFPAAAFATLTSPARAFKLALILK